MTRYSEAPALSGHERVVKTGLEPQLEVRRQIEKLPEVALMSKLEGVDCRCIETTEDGIAYWDLDQILSTSERRLPWEKSRMHYYKVLFPSSMTEISQVVELQAGIMDSFEPRLLPRINQNELWQAIGLPNNKVWKKFQSKTLIVGGYSYGPVTSFLTERRITYLGQVPVEMGPAYEGKVVPLLSSVGVMSGDEVRRVVSSAVVHGLWGLKHWAGKQQKNLMIIRQGFYGSPPRYFGNPLSAEQTMMDSWSFDPLRLWATGGGRVVRIPTVGESMQTEVVLFSAGQLTPYALPGLKWSDYEKVLRRK